MNDICLRCKQRAKRKSSQFCSKRCTDIAAKKAPSLIRVPKDHVMYKDVKKAFAKNWLNKKVRKPTIFRMYLVTWSHKMRKSFEKYRDNVAKKRKLKTKEYKKFRSERRTCRLGDPSQKALCQRWDCWLCHAIRTGFMTSLRNKRNMVRMGSQRGVRFGGGIYLASSSSKAYEYAKNINNGSPYRAVIVTRTVLGKVQKLKHEEHSRMKPNKGYDSVRGVVGSPEFVVFNHNAVRPAYLILLK